MPKGRHAEALAQAEQLLEAIPKLGLPDMGIKRIIAHGVAAALELGELDAADAMLAIVRQARPGLVTPELRGQVAQLDARLSALRGNHEGVEAGFETAMATFRDLGTPFEQGVALCELAEWLEGQGRSDDAASMALEALALFERLGARPWLERVRPLLAAASSFPLARAQSVPVGRATLRRREMPRDCVNTTAAPTLARVQPGCEGRGTRLRLGPGGCRSRHRSPCRRHHPGTDAAVFAERVRDSGGRREAQLDKIVSATFILRDPEDFAGMNEEWQAWFPVDPPARQGAKLPIDAEGLRVSIAVIATA